MSTPSISAAHTKPLGKEPVETLEVHEPVVACDGGAGSSPATLGHPLVYLTVDDKTGRIDCPYCGRRFVLKK